MYSGAHSEAQQKVIQSSEQVPRRQEGVQQKPDALERPRTVGEQIKYELDCYKAWSAHYDQYAQVIGAKAAEADQRLAQLPLSVKASEGARQEYLALKAQHEAVLKEKQKYDEAVAYLKEEYDPFERMSQAVSELKVSSNRVDQLQHDQRQLRDTQHHLNEQLRSFEEQSGPQEREYEAKIQQIQPWTEHYRQEVERLQSACELDQYHFSIAVDAQGKAKPGYEAFVQEAQARKTQLEHSKAALQNNIAWMNWFDQQIKSIQSYRDGLTSARDATSKDLEATLTKLLAEEQASRAAQAKIEQASPQVHANTYARSQRT